MQLKKVLDRFQKYAEKAMHQWRVPGMAVAVTNQNTTLYAKGFGEKILGRKSPVNEKTVFQIGSISKSFTSALLAQLVDRGKIKWTDKVIKLLPGFRLQDAFATREFLIRDLLSQCSGLPPYSGRLLPHLGFTRNYIINTLRLIKPDSHFRTEYAYQNNLYLVAAAVIEKLTKRSWEENLRENIILPLGMKHTTASFEGYRKSTNKAGGHFLSSGPKRLVVSLPMNWPYQKWVYVMAPAGGINSNVLDLAKWLRLHLCQGKWAGRPLLSRKNTNILLSPFTDAGSTEWGEKKRYCLGWLSSEYDPYRMIWHNGGTSGMKSMAALIPEAGIGIVILCNMTETLLPEALARTFVDLWFNRPPRDWSRKLHLISSANALALGESPAPDTPHRPLKLYTGTYFNKLYGSATVVRTGQSLSVTVGPNKINLKMKHWGGDTFVVYWPGVLTTGAGVQFYPGRYGKIETLKIEGMNDDLSGVFIKI